MTEDRPIEDRPIDEVLAELAERAGVDAFQVRFNISHRYGTAPRYTFSVKYLPSETGGMRFAKEVSGSGYSMNAALGDCMVAIDAFNERIARRVERIDLGSAR